MSGDSFRVLDVEPNLGRGFRPEEAQSPGRDAVVVLGHDFWKNEFGADPGVVGQIVRFNGIDFSVIGVAPAGFTGLDQYIRPAFFIPVTMAPKLLASSEDVSTNRSNRGFTVEGRLRPGVSQAAAGAEIATLATSLEQSFPASNRGFGAAVRTEMQARIDFSQGDPTLVALLFSLGLVVLLIACANVANLMSGRGRARAREIAVRRAAASAIVFGLVPAFRATKADLVRALKAGELGQKRKRLFGRNVLVVVQVSGSLVLLVAATQVYRGFSFVLSHDPGFRTDHLIMMSFDPSLVRYSPEQTERFYKTVIDRAHELPGVQAATLTYSVPTGTNQSSRTVIPEGYQFQKGQGSLDIPGCTVDPDYFAKLGVPIILGRGFLKSDRAASPRVAIVNRTFADHYLGAHPLGKRLRVNGADGPWVEVVGVTATGKYFSVLETPMDYLYLPLSQDPQTQMMLVVETPGDAAALAAPLREMVHSMDANLPIFGVRTMSDFFDQRSVHTLRMIEEIVGTRVCSGWRWRWWGCMRWWRIKWRGGRGRSGFGWRLEQIAGM